jgi:hypothetical protein
MKDFKWEFRFFTMEFNKLIPELSVSDITNSLGIYLAYER